MAAMELENMLKLALRVKKDPKIAASLEKLGDFMESPEGIRFSQMIASGGADSIKAASEAMARGDKNAAKSAMSKLLSTKEGAAFASKLADVVSKT